MNVISREDLPMKRQEEVCEFLFDRHNCVTDQQEAIVSIFGNLCVDDRPFDGLLMELFDRISHHREHVFPKNEVLLRFCIDCLAGVGAFEYMMVVRNAVVTYHNKHFSISGFTPKIFEPDENILEDVMGMRTGIAIPEMYHTIACFLQEYINSRLRPAVRCSLQENEMHKQINLMLYGIKDHENVDTIPTEDAIFYLLCCGKMQWKKFGVFQSLIRAEKDSHRAPKDDYTKIFVEIPKLQRKTTQEWIQYIYSTVPDDIKSRFSDMHTAIVYGYLEDLKEAATKEVS